MHNRSTSSYFVPRIYGDKNPPPLPSLKQKSYFGQHGHTNFEYGMLGFICQGELLLWAANTHCNAYNTTKYTLMNVVNVKSKQFPQVMC